MVTSTLVGVADSYIVSDGAPSVVGGDYLVCGVCFILETRIGTLSGKTKIKLKFVAGEALVRHELLSRVWVTSGRQGPAPSGVVSATSVASVFFAGVVVMTTTLISTNKVPTTVRALSASPPRKYPTRTATIGFT